MSHAPLAPSTVTLSVPMAAPAAEIWRRIVVPELSRVWLGGFAFESSWRVGEALALAGVLSGRAYRETGTLLALEEGRLLSYSHWSALWRVPHTPQNRAVLTLTLTPAARGVTVQLHHALPAVEALSQHSHFFWRGALDQLRRIVEGEESGAPGIM